LKKAISLILLLISGLAPAQRYYLEVTAASATEKASLDSLGYIKIHPTPKAANDEAKSFLEKTKASGWLESEIVENGKTSDSTFRYVFLLGDRVKFMHIYIGKNPDAKKLRFPNKQPTPSSYRSLKPKLS
jgi:hypothetical protein